MKILYVCLDGVRFEKAKALSGLLDEQRQRKIERYRFDEDRLRSLCAGLLLRYALKRYCGLSDEELCFSSTQYGKPFLSSRDDLCFSLSHSGMIVAVAISDKEIGVDVEKKGHQDSVKIADRYFRENEKRYLETGEHDDRFTEIWTKKEAYLKCRGVGLGEALDSFDVLSDDLSPRFFCRDLGDYVLSACSAERINEAVDLSCVDFDELTTV